MSVKTYVSLAVLNAGQAIIFSAGLAVVMAMSIAGIRAGRNTVGDFVLINAMMIQLYQPLNFMGLVYREVKQAVIDIEMMSGILGQAPEVQDRPGAEALVVTEGHLRFEDVWFRYDPKREILRGVSFEVPPGKTVAVVGPSGAGKSTLSRLLFRFYEPYRGRITIDGQDIPAVTQASLREAIGMVPQDTVLFNDTIGYNIRYGRWGADEAEVEEAARLAQIDRLHRHRAGRLSGPGGRARPEAVRAARSSASPSPAPSSRRPPSWCSTRRPRRSTPSPNARYKTRSTACRAAAPRW